MVEVVAVVHLCKRHRAHVTPNLGTVNGSCYKYYAGVADGDWLVEDCGGLHVGNDRGDLDDSPCVMIHSRGLHGSRGSRA